jgi:hypothetical protein
MPFMASIIVGVIFVCLGASCAAIGSVLVHREIAAINRKVPDAQQISFAFMYPGKMQKIKPSTSASIQAEKRRRGGSGYRLQWLLSSQQPQYRSDSLGKRTSDEQ